MTDTNDTRMYRTQLTIWTTADPSRFTAEDLARAPQFRAGFLADRDTDVFTAEELAVRGVGGDVLAFFGIDRVPLCSYPECGEDGGPADVAVALVPHVANGLVDRWELACEGHRGWSAGDRRTNPGVIRYDLRPVTAERSGIAGQLTDDEIEAALVTLAEMHTGDPDLSDAQTDIADKVQDLWRQMDAEAAEADA
ncbi:hypothetical protein AB0F93_00445 [Micromonospora tulbaghiae]|uniref:hypothetical protein n=1 Tax=Micromonospora tulbaghiae TaxID=479978 RepID=UPI0033228594